MSAARRLINPSLWRCIEDSGQGKYRLATAAGWPHYPEFYKVVRAAKPISVSPLTLLRLQRVAHAVGFPTDEIFLDEKPVESRQQ